MQDIIKMSPAQLEKEEKKKQLDIHEIRVQTKRAAHDLVAKTVRDDSEDNGLHFQEHEI